LHATLVEAALAVGADSFSMDDMFLGVVREATFLAVDRIVKLAAGHVVCAIGFNCIVVARFLSWTLRTGNLAVCSFGGDFSADGKLSPSCQIQLLCEKR